MARLGINAGIGANDGTGDSLRIAGGKINTNFEEIYDYFGNGSTLSFTANVWEETRVGINTLGKVGIGTTSPTKILETLGDVEFVGNLNVSGTGLVTATTFTGTFSGNASSATYATSAGIATNANYATVAGVSTYAHTAGFATDATNAVNVIGTGIGSFYELHSTGITTLSASGGITTTGGDLYIGGDLYVKDDISYDEVTVSRNLNVTGLSTFTVVSVASSLTVDGKYYGDGSRLTGISGLATALSPDPTSALNAFFKTPKEIIVKSGENILVASDDTSGNLVFAREKNIRVASGGTMTVGAGTTILLNVLNIF